MSLRSHKPFSHTVSTVMCATSAFGMGVNKSNVKFVYHLSMPSSLSSYYQECGRAGRDGSVASCVMFYQFSDHLFLKSLIDGKVHQETREYETKELFEMLSFYENDFECRNLSISKYLGEQPKECDEDFFVSCDNCSVKKTAVQLFVLEEVEWVRNTIKTNPNLNLTVSKLVDLYCSTKESNANTKNGMLLKKRNAKTFIHRLLIDGILKETIHSFEISENGTGPKVTKMFDEPAEQPTPKQNHPNNL